MTGNAAWLNLFNTPQQYPYVPRQHSRFSKRTPWCPYECFLCCTLHKSKACLVRQAKGYDIAYTDEYFRLLRENYIFSGAKPADWADERELTHEECELSGLDVRRLCFYEELWRWNGLDDPDDEGSFISRRDEAIEYEIAGRRGIEHAFRDSRSAEKARRRLRDEKEKYFSYAGPVKRGLIGLRIRVPLHYDAEVSPCATSIHSNVSLKAYTFSGLKTLPAEWPTITMTKQLAYREAQKWPRPPKRHRRESRETEPKDYKNRGWRASWKASRGGMQVLKEENALWESGLGVMSRLDLVYDGIEKHEAMSAWSLSSDGPEGPWFCRPEGEGFECSLMDLVRGEGQRLRNGGQREGLHVDEDECRSTDVGSEGSDLDDMSCAESEWLLVEDEGEESDEIWSDGSDGHWMMLR